MSKNWAINRSRALCRLTLLALLLAALPTHAETLTASDSSGNRVDISDAPCPMEWLKNWKAAEFFYQGKTYKACWAMKGEQIIILDSGGDLTAIPVRMFGKPNRT